MVSRTRNHAGPLSVHRKFWRRWRGGRGGLGHAAFQDRRPFLCYFFQGWVDGTITGANMVFPLGGTMEDMLTELRWNAKDGLVALLQGMSFD